MKVHFHISRQSKPTDINSEQRYLTWIGEIDWPSLPQEGSTSWCHCDGWAVETIHRVYFNGPYVFERASESEPKAPVTIEIKTDDQVMDHLVLQHGFEDTRY